MIATLAPVTTLTPMPAIFTIAVTTLATITPVIFTATNCRRLTRTADRRTRSATDGCPQNSAVTATHALAHCGPCGPAKYTTEDRATINRKGTCAS
jgi:hypothetical protein